MSFHPSAGEPSATVFLAYRSGDGAATSSSSSSTSAAGGVQFPFDAADTGADLTLSSFRSSSEQPYSSPTQHYTGSYGALHSTLRPRAPLLPPSSLDVGVASVSPFAFSSSSDASTPFSPVWRLSASDAVKPAADASSPRFVPAQSAAISTSSSSSSSPSPSPALARRLKHREIDAARKQREISLLRELEALTDGRAVGAAATAGCAGSSSLRESETADGGRQRKKRKTKRGSAANNGDKRREKVSVLQASIDRIRALERRCDALSSAVEQQDSDDTQRWSQLLHCVLAGHPAPPAAETSSASSLSLLAPAVRDCLSYLVHHHSLYASAFLHSPFCVVLTDVSTGRVVDANARFFSWSGWERAEIVNKRFTRAHSVCSPSGSFPLHPPPQLDLSDAPLVRVGPGKLRRPSMVPPQFPRSVELKKELLDGRLPVITAPWRSFMADGRVWEVECRTWVSRYDSAHDGQGRAIRIPQEMVLLFEEGKLVDDWEWGRQPQRSRAH